MEELRSLEGVDEAVRGAAFLCRFASAEKKHPFGIVTNFPSLHGDLYLGWAQLHSTVGQLAYQGPLLRDCPYSYSLSDDRDFGRYVQVCCVARFSSGFWARILRAIWKASDPVSLRDRGVELTVGPSSSSSLGAGLFMLLFSFVYDGSAASVISGLVFSFAFAIIAQGLR